MNKLLAMAAAVGVLAGPAWGASGGSSGLRAQLARCAAIQDALNRLECFDVLTRSMGLSASPAGNSAAPGSAGTPARPASIPAAVPPVGVPTVATPVPQSTTATVAGWRVVIKRDDKGRVHSVTLQTAAAQGVGVRGDPVLLSLRCMDTETSVFINWESYVGNDSVPVTVNVGGSGSSRNNWRISPDGTMTYYPGKAVAFVQSLLAAGQLGARVNPYGGHEISASFDLRGLPSAIQPLRQACRW